MPSARARLLCFVVGAVLGLLPVAAAAQAPDAYFEFLMARRYESEGNNQAALQALERASTASPASAEIKAELAAFYFRRNQRPEAERAARAALALDEQSVEANRILGQVLTAVVESSTERTPTLQTAATLTDAIMHLERALAGSPAPDIQVQYTLGQLYIRSGQSDKAVQILTRVLGQNPNSVQGRLTLARAYASALDLPGAIGVLDEIVEDEPRVAAALAQYQEQAGRPADAARSYTVALSQQPTNAELKLRRVVALLAAKDFARAATAAGDARKQHQQDLRFPQLQARALFEGGDKSGAIAVLESAVRAAPADSATQFALVDLYQDAGRTADAERVLRQIVSNEPANANALNTLGYMLAVRGDKLDEAITLVKRALDKEPTNGAFLDSLGWAHFRKGDLNEAEKYLTQAAERMPDNAEILDHLGDLHAKRGRWQDAITQWTRALEHEPLAGSTAERAAVERKIADAKTKIRR
jgi:tetratricopeptide (TPR) repeat protein